jgi:hypothetical protein
MKLFEKKAKNFNSFIKLNENDDISILKRKLIEDDIISDESDVKISNDNRSKDTQNFFSNVVTGEDDKFKPKKNWEPLIKMDKEDQKVEDVYNKFNGNFDLHIATSIPGFRDVQIKVIKSIVKVFGNKKSLMYDIGGSEGGFVKAITLLSNGNIRTINVDANSDMQKSHDKNPVEGSIFAKSAFGEGFDNDGEFIEKYEPSDKADIVHESMTFQFISDTRDDKIKEVFDKYIKPDGLFISEEKFSHENEKQWKANEDMKDKKYKSKYYDDNQISIKREVVLTGMKSNNI